jgi:isocitrate dehydrogenase
LSEAVEIATQKILDLNRSPKRKVGQQDNRTSHFYFALYWSEAIANQALDVDLASSFKHVSKALKDNESLILEEFKSGQGTTVDLGGYYLPNAEKVESIMRPSKTFNQIIASVFEL